MKTIKIFSAICLITMASFFISSCSKSDTTGSGGGLNPGAQNVAIQSMQFQPSVVTVVTGTMITWTNKDAVNHTVTSDDGTSFDSGNIAPQGTFSFTPTVVGAYFYHCANHPTETGKIQVVTK